ncbi:hypothetical protein K8R20_02575 [bacterium]|nr:hypothetical protein [bacterium]
MHDAVCDACGKDCKVPFKPTGSKPIYCSNCFEKQEGGSPKRRDRKNSKGFEMFSAICDDCGNECQVPFKPSSDKPIYCSACFEKRGNGRPAGGRSNLNLNEVNEKLDRIIKILEDQEF